MNNYLKNINIKLVILVMLSIITSTTLQAAEVAQASSPAPVESGSSVHWIYYLVFSVILLEMCAVIVLSRTIFQLTHLKKIQEAEASGIPLKPEKTLFQRLNDTVPIEEEDSLDMAHNYDGIRELDNKVPGWWQYAFYATIIFGFIYIYRMFGSETLHSQYKELEDANAIAAEQKAEYLKKNAANVDENTVTMLDAAGIETGSKIFANKCIACHGDKGQGNAVGPNLTDDYWIHKGSIKDVFYTIKYGWAGTAMKSWKDDLNPLEIAQLASYIKSLKGSNPEGAKEKQGELFIEEGSSNTPKDSTIKIDSTKK